ncbi:hypothetical protein C8R46DRAFT_1224425 [Mycena filopes]|nr:hypothetical protein C8R46DRAFT_1224425 [Mycena filopes]
MPKPKPTSLVGKLHAAVATEAPEISSRIVHKELEQCISTLENGCPAHELRSHFRRLQAYLDAEDLPPTGSYLHDLLSIKHFMLAFHGMALILDAARKHPSVLPQILDDIREAWPAVWRYMEFVEKDSLWANDSPIVRGGVIIDFTLPSIYEFLAENALVDITEASSSNVHGLFVRLWFRLATDARCEGWHVYTCILGFSIFIPRTPDEKREKIIAPLGGEVIVAKVAIAHLRNAMESMTEQKSIICAFQTVATVRVMSTVPKVAYALLGHNVMRHVTRALLAFTRIQVPLTAKFDFALALAYITANITFTDSITWVIQALDAGILIVLLRFETLYASDSYIEDPGPQLVELLVVQSAQKAVKKAKKAGAEHGISRSSDIWASWLDFQSLINKRVDLAGKSRADWDARHRQNCKELKRNRLAGRIVNSSKADYTVVPSFIIQDLTDLNIIDLCREEMHPPDVETWDEADDFEGPTRRDVVCVHVTLPNEQDTWFALRCDRRRHSTRAAQLLAALSSGSVMAHSEPGLEREEDWFNEPGDSDSDSAEWEADDDEDE